jgi:3-oxoacyl-[acyl-carrier protein] reductase
MMLGPIEMMRLTVDGMIARRFGDPVEFGAYAAFLCSAHAGYITAQNLLIDGGSYPATY